MDHLRAGDILPQEVAVPVCKLLSLTLTKMTEAMKRQEDEIVATTGDCKTLFAPNPPAARYLKLNPQIAIAFGLKGPPSRGGKPRHPPPSDQFFDIYDELRGYGANKSHAQDILAHRFGVTTRTIQRKLKQRKGASHIPYEPYLKTRLATAVWNLQKTGVHPQEAYKQVATDFGLTIQDKLSGPEIVETAVKLCERHRAGWARVPLEVCQEESDRRPPTSWPTAESVAEVRSLAARWGESPATIDSIARDLGRTMPEHQAVQAIVKKLGLKQALRYRSRSF